MDVAEQYARKLRRTLTARSYSENIAKSFARQQFMSYGLEVIDEASILHRCPVPKRLSLIRRPPRMPIPRSSSLSLDRARRKPSGGLEARHDHQAFVGSLVLDVGSLAPEGRFAGSARRLTPPYRDSLGLRNSMASSNSNNDPPLIKPASLAIHGSRRRTAAPSMAPWGQIPDYPERDTSSDGCPSGSRTARKPPAFPTDRRPNNAPAIKCRSISELISGYPSPA